MIQLHIPAEHADAVREALTCVACDEEGVTGNGRCPSSFWWGVKAHPNWEGGNTDVSDPFIFPADVQAMLNPCENARGLCGLVIPPDAREAWGGHERLSCSQCSDGHPLVELVTDCPWADSHHMLRGVCPGCMDANTVSLGVVTATEVLPIDECDDWCLIYEPLATHAVHLTRQETP